LTTLEHKSNVLLVSRTGTQKEHRMNAADAAKMAIEYNRNEPEFSPALEAEILEGHAFIRVQSKPLNGSGSRMQYWAMPMVRTATLGLVGVADPQIVAMSRKRGAKDSAMAAWWGRKMFGAELPQEYVALV
jgi:hypothetical protein